MSRLDLRILGTVYTYRRDRGYPHGRVVNQAKCLYYMAMQGEDTSRRLWDNRSLSERFASYPASNVQALHLLSGCMNGRAPLIESSYHLIHEIPRLRVSAGRIARRTADGAALQGSPSALRFRTV